MFTPHAAPLLLRLIGRGDIPTSAGDTFRCLRDLAASGGRVAGLPALCSDSVGDALLVVDPTRVLVSLGDEVALDRARSATLEMSDSPDGNSELRPMFQRNSVALRLERVVGWDRGRRTAGGNSR